MPTVNIQLRTLYCKKTTESGHDEIYLIVGGSHGDGSRFHKLCPGGSGDADNGQAWDLNDSCDKKDRWLRFPVYTAPLHSGQTADVRIVFMESDGTDYGRALAAAANVAATSASDPLATAIGTIGQVIGATGLLQNEDDCLGAVDIVLQNKSGQLHWSYGFNGEHYSAHSPDILENPGGAPNLAFLHLRNIDGGDGDYHAYLAITMSA